MNRKEVQSILEKYLEENRDVLTLTLAKKIYAKHPKIFKNVETVRNLIRTRRKANGNHGKSFGDQFKRPKKDIKEWMKQVQIEPKLTNLTPAKILVLDIETAPLKAYAWGKWQQNIGQDQLISDWFCLAISAKWLFEEEVMGFKLNKGELLREDDRRIVTKMHSLLNQADIVIAHNGRKFDIKKLNARFIYHDLTPPSPYQVIDTLLHARKQFAFTSNRLDDLGALLGVGRKIDTGGFKLWARVMSGDMSAMDEMSKYCGGDVSLLEEVYFQLRPWIKPHPNLGLFIGDNLERCPSCGSNDLKPEGYYYTYINQYNAFQCSNCGAWSRSRKTNVPIHDNAHLKSSIP